MKAIRAGGAVLLSTLVLGACDNAGGPSDVLDDAITADAALVAADAAIEDVRQMTLGLIPTLSAMAEGPRAERSRTVTYFDVDGNEQDRFDAETTASLRIQTEVSGDVDREGWSASVDRARDVLVTGLLGAETTRTWNGTSEGSMSRSRHTDEAGERSYAMTSAGVITDLVRGVPREENPWPLSGTITRDVTVNITNGPNGDQTRQRTVQVVFDGTQFAALTVNGEVFELDLAAREGRRPIRRMN